MRNNFLVISNNVHLCSETLKGRASLKPFRQKPNGKNNGRGTRELV